MRIPWLCDAAVSTPPTPKAAVAGYGTNNGPPTPPRSPPMQERSQAAFVGGGGLQDYSGMLPCFLSMGAVFLVFSSSRSAMRRRRVSRGEITSSRKPRSAAR